MNDHALATPPVPAASARLSPEMRFACQVVRWVAIAFAAWMLIGLIAYWLSDPLLIAMHWQQAPGKRVYPPSAESRWICFGLQGAVWLLIALAARCAWRAAQACLQDDAFTPRAARALRGVAVFGMMAQLADMFVRPLVHLVLARDFDSPGPPMSIYYGPFDAVMIAALFALLVVAQILLMRARA